MSVECQVPSTQIDKGYGGCESNSHIAPSPQASETISERLVTVVHDHYR
jgi:hypothetical protein